jgi:hypothetical protein
MFGNAFVKERTIRLTANAKHEGPAMTPPLRRFNLVVHITASVGWLGAVAAFLVLCIVGLTSHNSDRAYAAYLVMNSIAWCILVPFALTALTTGLIHSLTTEWGLFRHYWIFVKLLLTLLATVVLIMKMKIIQQAGVLAASRGLDGCDHQNIKAGLLIHATGGLFVLLTTVVLSVYKPWGLTRYGMRKLLMRRQSSGEAVLEVPKNEAIIPFGLKLFLAIGGILVAAFLLLHLAGGHGGHFH